MTSKMPKPCLFQCHENDGIIMKHKLKTETFSQKIEYSGGVILFAPNPVI